jgi:hypothetical protein
MPRQPRPQPDAELAAVRDLAEQLATVEAEADRLRAERDLAMLAAVQAGADKVHVAAAAGIDRRNVYPALAKLGYDPRAWR